MSEAESFTQRPMNPGFHRLFVDQLAVMYNAEVQLTHALPVVAKAAQSEDLKELVEIHLTETKGHVEAIKKIAESLQVELPSKSCKPMKSMINDTVKLIIKDFSLRDKAIIFAAQRIEHYEIAAYGTLCAWAKEMGHLHELALLTSILDQEKLAAMLLTGVASGRAPLKKLVEEASLKMAGATKPPQPAP